MLKCVYKNNLKSEDSIHW